MNNLKDFLVKEVDQAVERELIKKQIKEESKNLYDAVNALAKLQKENANSKKVKLADKLVTLAEDRVVAGYDKLFERCDCEAGEGRMLKGQLRTIIANAKKLYHMISEEDQVEDWVQSKITMAEDYVNTAYSYLTYYNGEGHADESDWDYDDDDDDDDGDSGDSLEDFTEEAWDYDEEVTPQTVVLAIATPEQSTALDPNIDDDELFNIQTLKR